MRDTPPPNEVRSYLALMHELAIRIELVGAACEGHLNLTPPYAREYAYLQFRRCCELIALGCLFLHGDLPGAKTNAALACPRKTVPVRVRGYPIE